MSWLARRDAHDHSSGIRRHPVRWAGVRRAALRRMALRYAEHGWDVVPGACHTGRRFDCGRPSCPTEGCHPAVPNWESVASSDPAQIQTWWSDLPYTILLATGRAFDVVEVSADLGREAIQGRPDLSMRGPVAVAGDGRWMFLVRPGHGLRPELLGRPDIVLHGSGSWIPAPPSRVLTGRVSWRIAPEDPEWRPADPYVVQLLLSRALHAQSSARPVSAWPPGNLARRAA